MIIDHLSLAKNQMINLDGFANAHDQLLISRIQENPPQSPFFKGGGPRGCSRVSPLSKRGARGDFHGKKSSLRFPAFAGTGSPESRDLITHLKNWIPAPVPDHDPGFAGMTEKGILGLLTRPSMLNDQCSMFNDQCEERRFLLSRA